MAGIISTARGFIPQTRVAGAPNKEDAPRGSGCRDWVKYTRQASFKGIPFEVAEDTKGGGRRLAVHVYPNRDTYDVEDLGKDVVTYSIQAYVIGDDADQYCDMLYEACSSQAGPGLLVLPLRRPAQAWLTHIDTTNVYDEMGRIPCNMEFVEESRPRGGLFSTAYHQNIISGRANEAAGAINAAFSVAFDTVFRGFSPVDFVPAIARATAAGEIRRAAEALDAARVGVNIRGRKEEAALVEYAIRRMKRDARYLAYRGQRPNRYDSDTFIADQTIIKSGLAGLVSESLRRIGTLGDTPEATYASLNELTGYRAIAIERAKVGQARSERAETVLTEEISNLLRRHSLVRLADVSTRRKFRTREDANQMKADLAQAFQSEMAEIGEVELFEPLRAVLEASANFLSQTAKAAPSAIRVRSPTALPACVAAYQLYTNSNKTADLMEINGRSIHPLFMPATFEAPLSLGQAKRAAS